MLANYPRVEKALELRWGYKEFRPYLLSLLSDSRGSRKGFSIEAITELMNLLDKHDEEFPEFKPNEEGWASTFY